MSDNDKQPTTPAGDTGTQPGGDKPTQAATPERTFTQADLDRIIAERLSRQEQSIKAQYADYPTLKDNAEKWLKHEDSQKSELQRIQDAAKAERDALQAQLDTLKTEREALSATARAAQTRAAMMTEASAQGISGKQLEAAYKLLDPSKLKFNDKGEVENAAAQVKTLIEEYPFLKTSEAQPKTAQPGIKPTNPAGGKTGPDLSWFKPAGRGGSSFTPGGVRPPQGDE
jgi:hypothetical protein